jgi:hypothetical protein
MIMAQFDRYLRNSYDDLVRSEKYADVRKNYQIISELLIEIVFPKFVKKSLRIKDEE